MRHLKFLALIPALLLCAAPTLSEAGVNLNFSVSVAPPVLPVYVQPPLPAPGYIWTPGYWAWGGTDYYWVPGTWVLPPASDVLWTPGYWSWRNGFYGWSPGYWGPVVGFYGGVNYGFGYTGVGFQGGYWHGGAFFYNRAVANFGRTRVVNIYNTPIPRHERSRISFNGGEGGLRRGAHGPHIAKGVLGGDLGQHIGIQCKGAEMVAGDHLRADGGTGTPGKHGAVISRSSQNISARRWRQPSQRRLQRQGADLGSASPAEVIAGLQFGHPKGEPSRR